MLLEKVNTDSSWQDMLEVDPTAPVMATPSSALACPAVAKAAGFVVGAAAVIGAAVVAYVTATGGQEDDQIRQP